MARVRAGLTIVASKRAPSRGFEVGDAIVVVATHGSVSGQGVGVSGQGEELSCLVCAGHEDAAAIAAALKAPEPTEAARAAAAEAKARAKNPAFDIPAAMARATLGAKGWDEALRSAEADEVEPPGGENGGMRHELVGTVTEPIAFIFNEPSSGRATVVRAAVTVESCSEGICMVTFKRGDVVSRTPMAEDQLRAQLRYEGITPADTPIAVSVALMGCVRPLIKELPRSKLLEPDSISLLDVIDTLEAGGIKTDMAGMSANEKSMWAIARACALSEKINAAPVDVGFVWPSTSPARLGVAIKEHLKGGEGSGTETDRLEGADRYPLYAAVRSIAKTTSEFEEAVKHSVEINFAGRKSHAQDNEYVLRGGIERMLKESKSFDTAMKITSYTSAKLCKGEIDSLFSEAAADKKDSSTASSSTTRQSDCEQQREKFEFKGASASAADATLSSQMRIDVQTVASSQAKSEQLAEARRVAVENPGALRAHIEGCDIEIKRVCTSPLDINQHLNGNQPNPPSERP